MRVRRTARERSLAESNRRMMTRRSAVHGLNIIVKNLDLPLPKLDPKQVDLRQMGRVLRVLLKRATEGAVHDQFVAAVVSYCSHGGRVPGGLALVDDAGSPALRGSDADEEHAPENHGDRLST